jgi:hypothetical protein
VPTRKSVRIPGATRRFTVLSGTGVPARATGVLLEGLRRRSVVTAEARRWYNRGMKVKTSVTLSEELIEALDVVTFQTEE